MSTTEAPLPNAEETFSMVLRALSDFPEFKRISESDIVVLVRQKLIGQMWKEDRREIEDDLDRISDEIEKLLLQEGENGAAAPREVRKYADTFGEDETDADVIGFFFDSKRDDIAKKILAHYGIVPTQDEWETLKAWGDGRLEAQRRIQWLVKCQALLTRQVSLLKPFIKYSQLKNLNESLNRLDDLIPLYKRQVKQQPHTTMSRELSKAEGAIAELREQLKTICLSAPQQ